MGQGTRLEQGDKNAVLSSFAPPICILIVILHHSKVHPHVNVHPHVTVHLHVMVHLHIMVHPHVAKVYLYNCMFVSFFTRLRSRRVVMCLVVVYIRSFVCSFPHRITSI